MTVNEIIKLLDKEENKYGGATGKERELYISIDGIFLGSIESAKLDGFGDGLITDATLELKTENYVATEKIRVKAIDEFAEALRLKCLDNVYCEVGMYSILKIAEQLKGGEYE